MKNNKKMENNYEIRIQQAGDYYKLLELEVLKYEAKDKIKAFRKNCKNYFQVNNKKVSDPYFILSHNLNQASHDFDKFKSQLEKKYNFEFSLDCSGSNSTSLLFTKFFKDRFIDEVKS